MEDLRKRIIYTLVMLLIYRVGSVIPTPGVNVDYIAQQVSNISMLGMLDFINGQNFSNFTIFAMGISPYITSSIIMQLLTIAIPALERLQKEGEEGRKKIAEITRVVTIALGCIMAIGIILGFGSGAMARGEDANFLDYALVFLTLAAGTALTMWIGERITQNGVGNGISLLIFVGYYCEFPGTGLYWYSVGDSQPHERVGHPRGHRGHHRPGCGHCVCGFRSAPDPRAVRQAHGRPQDVRRSVHPHPHEGQLHRRHAAHLCHFHHPVPRVDRAVLADLRVCAVVWQMV